MVFVSCVSLICPVGHSAASAAAALRAGIAAFAETGYRDVQGEPIVGATVPALDPELRGQARLLALIRLALDAMEPPLAAQLPWGRMPLILCTREAERPGSRLRRPAWRSSRANRWGKRRPSPCTASVLRPSPPRCSTRNRSGPRR